MKDDEALTNGPWKSVASKKVRGKKHHDFNPLHLNQHRQKKHTPTTEDNGFLKRLRSQESTFLQKSTEKKRLRLKFYRVYMLTY
ncbi:MAG: hypothetical protein H7833_20160 [Magnetococcus sp. DMHC-1]